MQEGRPAAVRELQPDPRRPAVQHQRRGRQGGARRRSTPRCRSATRMPTADTVFERRRPDAAAVDDALPGVRDACFWIEDVAAPRRFPALQGDRGSTWSWSAAATPGCGPPYARSSGTRSRVGAAARVAPARLGGVGAQRRVLRGVADPRRGQRAVTLARRDGRARTAGRGEPRRHRDDRRATTGWTATSSAPASCPSRSSRTRWTGSASWRRSPAGRSSTQTPCAPR